MMIKCKIIILLFLFFVFNLNCLAQNEKKQVKQINEWLSLSGKHFLKLESDKSLHFANKALELSLRLDESNLSAKAYNLIGLNFGDFSDEKKAIQYFKKGLKYAERTSNDTIKAWLNNNLANVYSYNKIDSEEGIKYYKRGLIYSSKLNDKYEVSFTKLNIVSGYFSMGKYDTGIVYLNEVKNYVENHGDLESKITLTSLYADYYNHFDKDEIANYYYSKSLEFCSQNNLEFIKSHITNTYKDVSSFYFKTKRFEEAYLYLNKHDSLQDIIYSEERVKQVGVEGQVTERNEVNRRIEVVEAEKSTQEEKLFQTRIIVVLFGVIFIILFLFLYSALKNSKSREKSNLRLIKANEDLKIAKEKAESASNIKTQFISNISHELRTPLYGVIGITDIIADEHKELKNSQHLKSLQFSAKYLLALVNDILKVYKIEEQKIVLENSIFNLKEEINTIVDSLKIIALTYKNELKIEFDDEIPEYLYGDKIRLSQILINLISNSLKFTNNGLVIIKVKAKNNINKTSNIEFKVVDNGIGIPQKFQSTIFEKFVQINRKEDDYQGTGLGLTIVKKLVTLFNGTISLESIENFGTTFTVVLPFESGIEKQKEIVSIIKEEVSEYLNYKILIVEDNKINQVVTKRLLENFKFTCVIADDGYQALEILKTEAFDAILMDINMPKINGFETSKLIRIKNKNIPIIAVTAFDKQEIEEKLIDAQINDVIVKPFESSQLFYLIDNLVRKKKVLNDSKN